MTKANQLWSTRMLRWCLNGSPFLPSLCRCPTFQVCCPVTTRQVQTLVTQLHIHAERERVDVRWFNAQTHTLGGLCLPIELHTADMTEAISSSRCKPSVTTKTPFLVISLISPSQAGAVRHGDRQRVLSIVRLALFVSLQVDLNS